MSRIRIFADNWPGTYIHGSMITFSSTLSERRFHKNDIAFIINPYFRHYGKETLSSMDTNLKPNVSNSYNMKGILASCHFRNVLRTEEENTEE